MHALKPELDRLVDLAVLRPDEEDGAFLDAVVDAEREGELTREQAITLGALLGRSRAREIVRELGGAP